MQLGQEMGYEIPTRQLQLMQLTRKLTNIIQASHTLKGAVLENVENIKYLGVTIKNDLR